MEEKLNYYFALNAVEIRVSEYKIETPKNGRKIFKFEIDNDYIHGWSTAIGVGFTLYKLQNSKIFVRNEERKLVNAFFFKSMQKTKRGCVFYLQEAIKP